MARFIESINLRRSLVIEGYKFVLKSQSSSGGVGFYECRKPKMGLEVEVSISFLGGDKTYLHALGNKIPINLIGNSNIRLNDNISIQSIRKVLKYWPSILEDCEKCEEYEPKYKGLLFDLARWHRNVTRVGRYADYKKFHPSQKNRYLNILANNYGILRNKIIDTQYFDKVPMMEITFGQKLKQYLGPNFDVKKQMMIKHLGSTFRLDFAIPYGNKILVVEHDGPYHSKRTEQDKIRDLKVRSFLQYTYFKGVDIVRVIANKDTENEFFDKILEEKLNWLTT